MSELQNLLNQIEQHRIKLEEELNGKKGVNGEPDVPGLIQEEKDLQAEMTNGTRSAKKIQKDLKRVVARKLKVENFLTAIKDLDKFETSKKELQTLSTKKLKDKDKNAKITSIKAALNIIDNGNLEYLAKELAYEEDLKDLDLKKTKKDLKKEISTLTTEIKVLKSNGHEDEAKDKEEDQKEKKELLAKIDEYLNNKIDETTLEADLNKLADAATPADEKKKIVDKYTKLIEDAEKIVAEELLKDIEASKAKEDEKKSTKFSLDLKSAGLKTVLKVTAYVAAGAIMITGIIHICKACSKNQTQSNKPGYSQDQNANTSGYKPEYEEYYELTSQEYGIPKSEAIQYVNLAAEAYKTGFFGEATLSQIVDIIMAIENKNLQTVDNANLAQEFNTSFNVIANNYLFGATTDQDKKSIEVLDYLATPNSDIGQFLSGYRPLLSKIMNNPEDIEAKNDMYKYLEIFANSLNGFKNDKESLDNNQLVNDKAIVINYYDYYFIYNSFVAPAYPIFVPEDNDKLAKQYFDLQGTMISAMESPEFAGLCGFARTK